MPIQQKYYTVQYHGILSILFTMCTILSLSDAKHIQKYYYYQNTIKYYVVLFTMSGLGRAS